MFLSPAIPNVLACNSHGPFMPSMHSQEDSLSSITLEYHLVICVCGSAPSKTAGARGSIIEHEEVVARPVRDVVTHLRNLEGCFVQAYRHEEDAIIHFFPTCFRFSGRV